MEYSSMHSLNNAPNELLVHIFTFLPTKDLMLSVSLVNKLWKGVTDLDFFWKVLIRRDISDCLPVEGTSPKKYYCDKITNRIFQGIIAATGGLYHFSDRQITARIDPPKLQHIRSLTKANQINYNTNHIRFITCLEFLPTFTSNCLPYLVTSSADGTIRIQSQAHQQKKEDSQGPLILCRQIIYAHKELITSMVIQEIKGKFFLFSGSRDRSVSIFIQEPATENLQLLKTMNAFEAGISALTLETIASKQFLYVGLTTGKITLFDISDLDMIDEVSSSKQNDHHKKSISTITVQPISSMFYTASADKTIKVWKQQSNKITLLETINAHKDKVTSLLLNRLNNVLISGSLDGTIKIWTKEADTQKYEEKLTSLTDKKGIIGLKFDRNYHAQSFDKSGSVTSLKMRFFSINLSGIIKSCTYYPSHPTLTLNCKPIDPAKI